MFQWCTDLFPINRSLTGQGVRDTLAYIKALLPELVISEVPSGTKAFDWEVPEEWNIAQAWIRDETGRKILDFKENNLHVMGYSTPVNKTVNREELERHLFSLPDQPMAIPYVTSYYARDWGFCVNEEFRKNLSTGPFEVFIDSKLAPGSMTYGELIIQGASEDEILLTTYVCHPSMANNELSGPAVLIKIAQLLSNAQGLKYTYRILFLVETIGSIYYISKHINILKKKVQAGFVLTCMGDDRVFSYIPTRNGNTLTDRAAKSILKNMKSDVKYYSWLDRGSDERQFNAPGVDLPIGSLIRSKYGEYPEYHTSLDDLTVISPMGLSGGLNALLGAIEIIEKNGFYKIKVLCEPQLGKRNLYPTTSIKSIYDDTRPRMNTISYLDGKIDLLEVAHLCNLDFEVVWQVVQELLQNGLVEEVSPKV
ncbi:M28_like domain containing protein [Candidatus Nanopelagicaceae bacterium]